MHLLTLKLGFHLIQGPRSRNQFFYKVVNLRLDMTLNAVILNNLVEDPFIKLIKNRGINVLCDSDTM